MKRSPLLLMLLLAVSLMCAQTNPASPKPGSGVPETAVPGTSPNNPAPNAAPTNANPASATPATAPATTAPAAAPAANTPKTSQPATTGTTAPLTAQPTNSQPVAPSAQPGSSTNSGEAPEQPKTEILDSSATTAGVSTDGHDPILDPPPLPATITTLVGGTVTKVDHIRNHMTVRVFGGGQWKADFDERTHIFRNGAETTQLAIKKGERVYVDTMLDKKKHDILARNIRVGVAAPPADADGQVEDVDLQHRRITLRDQINSVPVHFSVDQQTRITHGSNPASLNDLKPGSLVHVKFSPDSSNRGMARDIAIVAAPGSRFTFIGKITYLDLHRGVMALQNTIDDKNYEVHFDPAKSASVRDQLAVGSEVRIVAVFEGTRYTAETINLTKDAESAEKQ